MNGYTITPQKRLFRATRYTLRVNGKRHSHYPTRQAAASGIASLLLTQD